MKNLQWGKGRTTSKASAVPPRGAQRIGKQINWRVCQERSQAGAAARESYLRSLMGLPAAPARDIDKERGR